MSDCHATRRRCQRFAATTAFAVAAGYGLALPLPYLAALLAVFLSAGASKAPGPKRIAGILIALAVTLGVGVVLGPLLQTYPLTGLLLMALGVFVSTRLAISEGQAEAGLLLSIGFAVIPAVAAIDAGLAATVIKAMMLATLVALLCQLLAFALFPEPEGAVAPAPLPPPKPADNQWIALRATLFMAPPVFLLLTDPVFYLPVAMKALLLSREASTVSARAATRELLGSTAAGGAGAVLFWLCLGLAPTLWLFTLWTALFAGYTAARSYGLKASRHPPSWWLNALVTLLILVGAAVQDSALGKDVYQAFALRMALFLGVTLYAIIALQGLEAWRRRRSTRATGGIPAC